MSVTMPFPDGQKDEEIEDRERGEGDDVDEDEVHPRDVDADVDGVFAQRRGVTDGFVLPQLLQELRAVHTGPQNLMRGVKGDAGHHFHYKRLYTSARNPISDRVLPWRLFTSLFLSLIRDPA